MIAADPPAVEGPRSPVGSSNIGACGQVYRPASGIQLLREVRESDLLALSLADAAAVFGGAALRVRFVRFQAVRAEATPIKFDVVHIPVGQGLRVLGVITQRARDVVRSAAGVAGLIA